MALILDCDVSNHFRPDDLILADKGFTIHRLLPDGVNPKILPFLSVKGFFTSQEAKLCRKIAHANEHVKKFEILRRISDKYM